MAKEKLEEAKKTVRSERDVIMKDLAIREKTGGLGKDDIFRLKNEAQKIVDETNKKLDELAARKEKEILS
jgi:ribosome recycling factor